MRIGRRTDPRRCATRRQQDPWALVKAGRYAQAVTVLQREAERAVHHAGVQSIDAAQAYNRLGVACKFAGYLDQAARAYALALPVARRAGDEDPDFLATLLHNLGGLAHAYRCHAEAEEIAREGLALRQKHCSDERALAADLAALAAILESLERWQEAQELYLRALSIWTRCNDRYEIAMTLNGLAAVTRFDGRPDDAEPIFRQALKLLETVIGPTHPNTATVRNNLAMLLNATDRPRAALELLTQATQDLEATLGPHHQASIDVRTNRDRVRVTLNQGTRSPNPSRH